MPSPTTVGTRTADAWTTSRATLGQRCSVVGAAKIDRPALGALIDTSVWIALEKNELDVSALSTTARGLLTFTSPIVVGEIKQGVERALTPVQRKSRQDALDLIVRHPVIAIDATVANQWGVLSAQLAIQGTALRRSQDIWLAATAIVHQLCLITLNPRDFSDIPGLLVLVPPRKASPRIVESPESL
jgi:predicted nucleic acid-binding protein